MWREAPCISIQKALRVGGAFSDKALSALGHKAQICNAAQRSVEVGQSRTDRKSGRMRYTWLLLAKRAIQFILAKIRRTVNTHALKSGGAIREMLRPKPRRENNHTQAA